jgi:hypothetical protein
MPRSCSSSDMNAAFMSHEAPAGAGARSHGSLPGSLRHHGTGPAPGTIKNWPAASSPAGLVAASARYGPGTRMQQRLTGLHSLPSR